MPRLIVIPLHLRLGSLSETQQRARQFGRLSPSITCKAVGSRTRRLVALLTPRRPATALALGACRVGDVIPPAKDPNPAVLALSAQHNDIATTDLSGILLPDPPPLHSPRERGRKSGLLPPPGTMLVCTNVEMGGILLPDPLPLHSPMERGRKSRFLPPPGRMVCRQDLPRSFTCLLNILYSNSDGFPHVEFAPSLPFVILDILSAQRAGYHPVTNIQPRSLGTRAAPSSSPEHIGKQFFLSTVGVPRRNSPNIPVVFPSTNSSRS
ncbi:hypothetical protein C8F04DRAFT_1195825 [Mycena alexandri]|uniref:Uncharacterized protein n=1 Tax=Mycena alexandri TaxID=1745969 RepID=A0AAD6S6K8_9AGAR|nr:hypothetical protein C8F04DRAFT_1195825 [Mycena alexandri]